VNDQATQAPQRISLGPARLALINRVVGFVGLIAGLTLVVVGGFWLHRQHLDQFLLRPLSAYGRVIENRRVDSYRNGQRSGTSYRAVVNFTAQDGQQVTLSDWISFKPPAFFVGQFVLVLYDARNPQSAMIDRGAKNYYLPAFCYGVGGLMVLGSLQRLRSKRPA
jgi:hypothetical protein